MANEKIGKDVGLPGPNLFALVYGCLQSEATAFDSSESKELVLFLPLIFYKWPVTMTVTTAVLPRKRRIRLPLC